MDQHQTSDIADRRRAQTQIDELKRSCEQFDREKEMLSTKLSELNGIVDKLVDEKRRNKYDPSWKIDLKPYSDVISPKLTKSALSSMYHRGQIYSSINRNNDLIIDNNNFDNSTTLFRREQITSQKQTPSDAFKIKLFHCLQEIEQKAEEISKLSEHLYP